MRRLVYLLPLVAFVVLVGWFVLGLQHDPHVLPSALIDKPVPEFSLPPLPGFDRGLASSDLKGKVQLVNVFASWCLPCRAEQPVLVRLAKDFGVAIQAINWKDKPSDAVIWLRQNGNPFQSVGSDPDNKVGIDWGVYGAPETYVIDAHGRIRYRHVGPLMPFDIEEKILPLIRQLQG
ncbi:MAG: DsbE family thiol:disulfide interchange protein [Azospirillum sp.]|nr:DsbE family thiol:disulfide interchange protein [Azospirillum sp.]